MIWIVLMSVGFGLGVLWLRRKQEPAPPKSPLRKSADPVLVVRVPASSLCTAEAESPVPSPMTQPTSTSQQNPFPSPERLREKEIQRLQSRLLNIVGGDPGRVQWLIDHQRQRNPSGTMPEWIEAAIDIWERDNRSWK